MESRKENLTELDVALNLIANEIRDGLRHGHFDLAVRGETGNARKRFLTIKAGKSHRFCIPEDDLKN